MKHPGTVKQANASDRTKIGLSGKAPSRRECPGWLGGHRRDGRPAWRTGRGSGREEDLHHPAHQRSALEFHRDGAGLGLHPVHAQRRQDPGRVRAPGHLDREAESGARRIRVLCWCSTPATTAWGPRSLPPPARPAANCNCCPGWATTPPPSATMISTSGLTARRKPSAWPPRPAGFRRWSHRIPISTGSDPTLADLQHLAKDGVVRRHLVIERGGIRFGIFGRARQGGHVLHRWRRRC